MKLSAHARLALPALFVFLFLTAAINAQTTAFTYQGRLNDAAMPANGTYDMQFRLFDTAGAATGTQQGATVANPTVAVAGGIFTVQLDFGAAVFSTGANLFLEISLRSAGSTGGFTGLAPRQPLTSAPYAIRAVSAGQSDVALDANKLGGVNANQYVTGAVVKTVNNLSNDVTLAAGSNITITPSGNTLTIGLTANSGAIQNQTTQQTGASFNIDGTGTANIFKTTTQYNIGNNRILSNLGTANLFVGVNAGKTNTTGSSNSFIGDSAGYFNAIGTQNTFVGGQAGYNTTNSKNTFVGYQAGNTNTTGSNNTAIGSNADVSSSNLVNATAIGAGARVSTSNTIMLGQSGTKVITNGIVTLLDIGVGGTTALCRNSNGEISFCSSSLRYKTNIAPFAFGLNFVNRLRPISFDWKDGGMHDVGFGAEEVAKINPLFVNYNDKGEVEGVKYDRLSVAFVNAFKEQQTQIAAQEKKARTQQQQIERQQQQIDALTKLVCQQNPQAEICQEN